MSARAVILLVEDEASTRALMQVMLAQNGYHCIHASTGLAGVAAVVNHAPSAILLDLGLPDIDGLEVIRRIREHSSVPIIVVSARAKEIDKIDALDGGANDYVAKPFGPGELLARIRAALRSVPRDSEVPRTGKLTAGDLTVDLDFRRVTVAGADVYLTPIELRLLVLLMASGGRVVTHQHILRTVWGPRFASQVNYLRVYMTKLRHKIEREPTRPRYLVNEPGVGYRLIANQDG